jgi:hypothetical protein
MNEDRTGLWLLCIFRYYYVSVVVLCLIFYACVTGKNGYGCKWTQVRANQYLYWIPISYEKYMLYVFDCAWNFCLYKREIAPIEIY